MGRPVGVTFTVCIKILKTLKLKIHPKSDKRGRGEGGREKASC